MGTPDVNLLFRRFLLASATLTALVPEASIIAGDLPEGTNPAVTPTVSFFVRGGTVELEAPIVRPSIQVRVWAGINQQSVARRIYNVIHDWVHGKCGLSFGADGTIMSCLCSVYGQDVTDPDTNWSTVVGFYELMARCSDALDQEFVPEPTTFVRDKYNEVVDGGEHDWTLEYSPEPPESLLLVQRLENFGDVVLRAGVDFTLEGASKTTTNSIEAGALVAKQYRYSVSG